MKADSQLIEQSLAGSREAYGELVRRYERTVFAAAGAVLRDFNDVQDAAQETFLLVYRRLGQLRDPGALGQWLVSIVRTQALKLAAKRRQASGLDANALAIAEHDDHKVSPETGELLQAVMKLPDSQRQAILMRYFGDMSVSEIAEATGQAVGSVTSQLSRAYENLRTRIGEGGT